MIDPNQGSVTWRDLRIMDQFALARRSDLSHVLVMVFVSPEVAIESVPGFSEPVASWLHLLAAGACAFMIHSLARMGRDLPAKIGLASFAASATAMLAISGTYHLLEPGGAPRIVLQRIDHAAIWILIAATLTAVHTTAFRGAWRWAATVFVWLVALTGVVMKTLYFEELPEAVGLGSYLGLGWFGIVSFIQVLRHRGRRPALMLMAGGLVYSLGALLEFLDAPTVIPGVLGPHEIFHALVVIAIVIHWRAMVSVCRAQSPQSKLDSGVVRGDSVGALRRSSIRQQRKARLRALAMRVAGGRR